MMQEECFLTESIYPVDRVFDDHIQNVENPSYYEEETSYMISPQAVIQCFASIDEPI